MLEDTIDFINQIIKTNNEIGNLIEVEYLIYSDIDDINSSQMIVEAIILSFEHKVFTIKAIANDDTIKLIYGRINANSSQKTIAVSQHKPWSIAIGKRISWSWALINQQGYPDAIQFEFYEHNPTTSITIQLITAASSIGVYRLNRII